MKLPVRFWVHLLSHLALVAILAGLLAGWVGTFFEALAGHSSAATDGARVGDVGTVFGFCMLALLLLGALTVTGELFGLARPYSRDAPYRNEAQAMYRKVLLIAVALLSWGGLASATLIGSLMRSG
ncbi:hypothetical protein [Stenotrophomonas maltophilia]|uniref:hypothetical protein n=1 Tax=Stenotrophomonas maltophilia TaxID=40324 RepID=UPI0006AC7F93|nr:hypothetical protein [Stenotrophomonas maltophilia]KOQ70286.1 hypothetical protein ABW43_06075 [Stenotrophomonas maltophilia]